MPPDLWETAPCWMEMQLNGFLFLFSPFLELLRLEKLSKVSIQPCLGFDVSARAPCGPCRDTPGGYSGPFSSLHLRGFCSVQVWGINPSSATLTDRTKPPRLGSQQAHPEDAAAKRWNFSCFAFNSKYCNSWNIIVLENKKFLKNKSKMHYKQNTNASDH